MILRARRKIFSRMCSLIPVDSMESVVDVGVTADRACGFSNFFEMLYPYPERITAFSDQDASWMAEQWPGLKFVRGDGRELPFQDRSFDLVFSSAVVEHVGTSEQQRKFLSECIRVAKKHVFLTTPNRWYPFEMHTGLPFLHWLPKTLHRKLIGALGFKDLSKESNLNLLSADDLRGMIHGLGVEDASIDYLRFYGFKSNLLLHIRKS